MMAAAFAPTLTRLLADARGHAIVLAQLCTADVAAQKAPGAGSGEPDRPADGGPSTAATGDCPWCTPHAFSFALPPTATADAVPSRGSEGPPARALSSPRPLYAWIAATPRGPPRIS